MVATVKFSVASLLPTTLYQGNPDRNYKLWNNVSFESSQWENLNNLFCCKVSFLTGPYWQSRGVGQGMKEIYLYLWYPLFQAKLDRCDQQNNVINEKLDISAYIKKSLKIPKG